MKRFLTGALVLTGGLLINGCANMKQMADNLNCHPENCLRTYPADDLGDQDYWSFDSITVLPPQLAIEERTLDGTTIAAPQTTAYGQRLLLEQLNRIAGSYQIQNTALEQNDQLAPAIDQLYADAWSDNLSPRQVRDATPMFGSPNLPAPVQTRELAIPASLLQRAEDSCCFLLSRFSGWHHTSEAKSAKVATAVIFSALPGGSGVAGSFGSAISDMAVIRKSDGKVLWSARLISDGRPSQLRTTAVDFYSRVYNAKSLKGASGTGN